VFFGNIHLNYQPSINKPPS